MEPDPHVLARQAYARELAVRDIGTEAAELLERMAAGGSPLSPAQARAVAMKLRRDMQGA